MPASAAVAFVEKTVLDSGDTVTYKKVARDLQVCVTGPALALRVDRKASLLQIESMLIIARCNACFIPHRFPGMKPRSRFTPSPMAVPTFSCATC